MDKRYSINAHFKRQLSRRLGLGINHRARLDIIESIKLGKSTLIGSESISKKVYRVSVPESFRLKNPNFVGDSLVIVYDSIRGIPITVLTEEMTMESLRLGRWS